MKKTTVINSFTDKELDSIRSWVAQINHDMHIMESMLYLYESEKDELRNPSNYGPVEEREAIDRISKWRLSVNRTLNNVKNLGYVLVER